MHKSRRRHRYKGNGRYLVLLYIIKLSNKDMPSIAKLENVETLDLSNTAVTD